MTNRRKRVYEIALIVCCLIIIGLTAYMGITAMQKSLTLNLKFNAQPSQFIHIEYKLPSESNNAYKTLFCNVTDANEGLTPNVTANASLSGNTLTLTEEFDKLGGTYDFRITNYNDYDLKVTCANVSKNTISNGNPIVFSSISTGGANVVFSFEEYVPPTITFDFNGGKIGEAEYVEYKTETLPTSLGSGYIPTMPNYTFAGYYSVDSTPEAIPDSSTKCYTYDYLTNTAGAGTATVVSGINTTISDDITLYARWLPFVIGNYVEGTGSQVPDQTVVSNGADVIYDAFAGYKYIQFKDATVYNGYPLRWIIIGAGEGKNTALAGADIGTITSYAFDGNVNGKEGNNTELGSDQVLVLSEQVLKTNVFNASKSDGNEWKTSDIHDLLNGDFINDNNSNLNDYIGTYIIQPNKNLNTAYNNGSAVANSIDTTATNSKSSYIFLLGSRFGYLSGDGNTASIKANMGTESSVADETKAMYYVQNFVVEDYLGTQDVAESNITAVTKTIGGVEYTYSGGGDYILGTGTAPKLASFPGASQYYWWLRSGYYSSSAYAYSVFSNGRVIYDSGVNYNHLGVRPSFCLNLA